MSNIIIGTKRTHTQKLLSAFALLFLLMFGGAQLQAQEPEPFAVNGFASTSEESGTQPQSITAPPQRGQGLISDPLEKSNRDVDEFNTAVDRYTLLLLTKGWDFITPTFVQTGLTNFFSHLGIPYTMFNSVLQLKPRVFYKEFSRFVINTIFGVAGLVDVAAHMGIEGQSEDLGQTLGAWGVPAGPYLVIPLLGPTTARDIGPFFLELFYAPNALQYIGLTPSEQTALAFVGLINSRNNLRRLDDLVVGDRYTFIRDAYMQNRQYEVLDGQVPWSEFQWEEEDTDELEELDQLDDL